MTSIKERLTYKILREIYRWFKETYLRPFFSLNGRIKEVVREHLWENRLGIKTVGVSPAEKEVTLFKDSVRYEPTPYYIIEAMLRNLRFGPEDVLIDIGCGKGRVIFSVATKKFKKIIGIEAREDILEVARQNLKNLKSNNTPLQIIKADAATFDMKEGTVFFMFNPFWGKTLIKVMENIKSSLLINPRDIRIVCYYLPNLNMIEGCDWLTDEGRFEKDLLRIWSYKA